MYPKYAFYIFIALMGLVATVYSVGKFMFFLSEPYSSKNVAENSILASLLIDMLLLSTFLLQHTFMVLPSVKHIMSSYGLDVISRSIYILITSILLMILVKYWQTISEVVLWKFDTTGYLTWLLFVGVHVTAWSIIYAGCLFMDISELLGIKQVYYNLNKMPDPIEFKSTDLQRLYDHTRHPSFSAFCFIFWFYPTMTLDRLVLASIMTMYMFLTWKTDKYDLKYQQVQYSRKNQELYGN